MLRTRQCKGDKVREQFTLTLGYRTLDVPAESSYKLWGSIGRAGVAWG